MDEFIEQFIIESREYLEQANAALHTLEDQSHDAPALEALFRSVHTLKGSAGIIEFSAMERLLHALESDLGRLKSHHGAVSDELNSRVLACLDLVARWLDRMEQSGAPPSDADAEATALLSRLSEAAAREPVKPASSRSWPSWLDDTLKKHDDVRSRALTAIRYTPTPDCFFRGEDPLALIEALPGLLTLDLDPIADLPPLSELDPYESLLTYTALCAATRSEVETYLKDHFEECEVVSLPSVTQPARGGALTPAARELLEAQFELLTKTRAETFAGVVSAAGTTAVNALSHCGLVAAAAKIEAGMERSLATKDVGHLREQLDWALHGTAAAEPVVTTSLPRFGLSTRTLRVDAERIEALVRLVAELTVVKNAIGHLSKVAQSEGTTLATSIKDQHGALDRLTSELQRAVLGMRVLPLRTVLGRFPPVVREMAANLGKPTKLLIEGDDTEADKAIIEVLFEPLLHVVRNALDHGIESAELRAQRNKPPVATIAIRASRQGDRILIQVSDDGGGIDVERIRQVALDRNILREEQLAELGKAELIDLIFSPGFSTASEVTELSGRGVGMDVVRSAVSRIGGSVTIDSRSGEGTTVEFALPFSVMMSHVMTVEAGGQTFGIPIDAVVETIRVPLGSMAGVGAAKAIAHRNRTLPIFELSDLLQTPACMPPGGEAVIVVTTFGGHWGGIRVDRLGERLEVMLKPLDGILTGIRGITGTTIMGDGRVLLVLDMGEILA